MVLDDIIADMLKKNLWLIVTELFIGSRKLNISFVFITQSYLTIPRNIRLTYTLYLNMKIPNKWKLQQTAFNNSSDIDFKKKKTLWTFRNSALQSCILYILDAIF